MDTHTRMYTQALLESYNRMHKSVLSPDVDANVIISFMTSLFSCSHYIVVMFALRWLYDCLDYFALEHRAAIIEVCASVCECVRGGEMSACTLCVYVARVHARACVCVCVCVKLCVRLSGLLECVTVTLVPVLVTHNTLL